jgi:hypothetical protein
MTTNTVQPATLTAAQPPVTPSVQLPPASAVPVPVRVALAEKPQVIPSNGDGAPISIAGDLKGQEIKIGDRTISVSDKGIVIDLENGKKMAIKRLDDGRIAVATFDNGKETGFKLQSGTTAVKIPVGDNKIATLNLDVNAGGLSSFTLDTGSAALSAKRNAETGAFEYASGKGPAFLGKVIKNELAVDANNNVKLTSSLNNGSQSLTPSPVMTESVKGLQDLAESYGALGVGVNALITAFSNGQGVNVASIAQRNSAAA